MSITIFAYIDSTLKVVFDIKNQAKRCDAHLRIHTEFPSPGYLSRTFYRIGDVKDLQYD